MIRCLLVDAYSFLWSYRAHALRRACEGLLGQSSSLDRVHASSAIVLSFIPVARPFYRHRSSVDKCAWSGPLIVSVACV